jgi:pimeloyl-ACP methyl ester carboxylesterase
LTHNGTTTDQPLEFVDLEAFASNCYSFEKKDVLHVLNWLEEKIDLSTCSLHLVGHSRGGGIALLNADDNRIKSVITLAAISSIEKRFDLEKEELDNWEKNGVRYVRNGRTNQDLPHNFSQFIDFEENKQELSIKTVCESISKPVMHIHGGKDESVSISEGYDLSRWSRNQLYEIPEATHTFGGIHPYDLQTLPTHLEECCNRILEFLEKQKLCT